MGHGAQIPQTPQTDERNFPRHDPHAPPGQSGHPYPRMLTRPCTKQDQEEWIEKNRQIDRNTREEYWTEQRPRIGAQIPYLATQDLVDAGFAKTPGEPVIIESQADEELIFQTLGIEKPRPAPRATSVSELVDDDSEASRLEAENRRLEEALNKNRRLKAALAAEDEDEPAPRRRRARRTQRRAAARSRQPEAHDELADE